MKLYDGHTYYDVNDNFEIVQSHLKMGYSKQWRLIAIERFNNFGHSVERIDAKDIPNNPKLRYVNDLRYKNGKDKWYIVDYDHGTIRLWGKPLQGIYN